MKRFGRHEELANLASFLLSEQTEYINGECVVIDGGLWLRGAGEFNLIDTPDSEWESSNPAEVDARWRRAYVFCAEPGTNVERDER